MQAAPQMANPWWILGGFIAAAGVIGSMVVWVVNKYVDSMEGWLSKIDRRLEEAIRDHSTTREEIAGLRSEFVTDAHLDRRFSDFKDGFIGGMGTNPGVSWHGPERRGQPRG